MMKHTLFFGFVFLLSTASPGQNTSIVKLYQKKSVSGAETLLKEAIEKANSKGKTEYGIYFKYLLAEHYERYGKLKEAELLLLELQRLAAENKPSGGSGYIVSSATQKTFFDVTDRLGFFYVNLGNLQKAQELFTQSKKDRDAFYKTNSVHRAMPLAGLGSVAYRLKQYDKAYEFYQQAFDILQKSPTTNYDFDIIYRLIYSDMAEICLATNRLQDAGKYIEQLSLTASGKTKYGSKGGSQAEISRVMDLKARYQIAQGNFNRAQQYLNRAQDFVPKDVSTSALTFRLMFTQAQLNWLKGDIGGASAGFTALVNAYRGYLRTSFNTLTEYEKQKFYYSLKEHMEYFNAFVLHCHNAGKAKELGLFATLYNNQIYTKALLVSDVNAWKKRILNSGNAKLIATLNQWEELRGQLSGLYYKKNSEMEIASLEARVEQMEKELNAVGKAEAREYSWSEINKTLKPTEAAVEIIRVQEVSVKGQSLVKGGIAYIVLVNKPNQEVDAFVLSNGAELESRSARFYRNAIASKIDDELSYAKFWLPIKQKLSGTKRFFLSTDGVYAQINLNTIKIPNTAQYVLDEADIIYVTNTRDLLAQETINSKQTAYLFGRPAYSADLGVATESAYRSLANEELTTLAEQTFADLPGTEEEINTAFSTLQNSDWTLKKFVGVDASESNVKSIKSPKLLHIATHGFFIGDTTGTVNPMIRSGLLFSGVSKNSGNQDGILTAYEAALLNLEDTELVILSACETGLGELRNGEGVYGLQRAITAAGASNLLMSLWKVDDQATNLLMSNFYQGWTKQKTAGDAFREAQKNIRQKYPHPYYWGAFVMLGK